MIQFDEYGDSRRKLGNFTIVRSDPYGFWTIKPDKGRVPSELSGTYTSAQLAGQVVKNYMDKKKVA